MDYDLQLKHAVDMLNAAKKLQGSKSL